MKKRNQYTAEFKIKVVLEVLREEETLNEIAASRYEISPVRNSVRMFPTRSSATPDLYDRFRVGCFGRTESV